MARHPTVALALAMVVAASGGAARAADTDTLGRVKTQFPADAADAEAPPPRQDADALVAPQKTSEVLRPPVLDDRRYDGLRDRPADPRGLLPDRESGQIGFGDGKSGSRPPASADGPEAGGDIVVAMLGRSGVTPAAIVAQTRAQAGSALRRQGVGDAELEQLAQRAAAALAARGDAREARECSGEGRCLRVIVR